MLESLPLFVQAIFILTTLLTVFLFYRASGNIIVLWALLGWCFLQCLIGITGYYTDTLSLPPKFLLLVVPPLLTIVAIFCTKWGRAFMDGLDNRQLTYLHAIRIPVELVLYYLYEQHLIPELMTFEGRNFDVLSGLTAPFVAYFGYMRPKLPKAVLLAWNFICLLLLLNIVINAVLSAPTRFQQFGFEQPNVAVAYFPFVWLPAVIVPIVLLSHLVCIRQLLKKETVIQTPASPAKARTL